MVAGQRGQWHRDCRTVIDPDGLLDLRPQGRFMPHTDMKDLGLDDVAGLIRSQRRVAAEMAHIVIGQHEPDFLIKLAAKRADGTLAVFDLAASLHEPFGPCFADQQQTAGIVIDQGRCNPDRAGGSALMASC